MPWVNCKHQLPSSPLLHQGTNTPRYGFGAWRSGGSIIYLHPNPQQIYRKSAITQTSASRVSNFSSLILAVCEEPLTACLIACLLRPETAELSRAEAGAGSAAVQRRGWAHGQRFPLSFPPLPGGHPLPHAAGLQAKALFPLPSKGREHGCQVFCCCANSQGEEEKQRQKSKLAGSAVPGTCKTLCCRGMVTRLVG